MSGLLLVSDGRVVSADGRFALARMLRDVMRARAVAPAALAAAVRRRPVLLPGEAAAVPVPAAVPLEAAAAGFARDARLARDAVPLVSGEASGAAFFRVARPAVPLVFAPLVLPLLEAPVPVLPELLDPLRVATTTSCPLPALWRRRRPLLVVYPQVVD